jgi:hypothetical protein
VKAIAPNAASGASRITMPTMANNPCWRASRTLSRGSARSRKRVSATPSRMENSNTWRISFRASASTTLVGIMFSTKSANESCRTAAV